MEARTTEPAPERAAQQATTPEPGLPTTAPARPPLRRRAGRFLMAAGLGLLALLTPALIAWLVFFALHFAGYDLP